MGLFDQYQFDQGNYGGGGSLIDRLLSQLQTQGQYQPSQGFEPNPMDANAQMQPQASPIGIGDYQMPRVGSPAQFTPDPAAIPQNAQPAQGQFAPQASSLPEFLQPSGPGNNLLAGLQSFGGNLQNGLISALVGGANGFATGQRNDPRGQQQQVLQAQYKALIPILGEQKAALAVLNPEIGKQLVAQATAGKQFGFTTLPDGTVVRQDAHTGKVETAYQGGLKPTFGVIGESDGQKTYGWIDPSKRSTTAVSGMEPRNDTVTGPDGKPIPIPPGADRKEFIKKVTDASAKAATGEKTEVQAKSEKFGNKMELAERNLKDIEDEGTGYLGRSAAGFPLVGGTMATNWMKSDKYQKYEQARNNFITALLRDESGAAIGTDEFNRYEKELFPQPGDGAGVINQKREARRIAIEGMKKSAGPGYKSPVYDSEAAGGDADPLGIRKK
jgi:hypothetical protein